MGIGLAPMTAAVLFAAGFVMVAISVTVGVMQSRHDGGWCASCLRPIIDGRCGCPRRGLRGFRRR